jgi:uncharacterized protein
MSAEAVIARRRAEREGLLERARQFVVTLQSRLSIRAAVVFGSVARGDFNRWSDIDLLIIAETIPPGHRHRVDATGERPPGLQPIIWTTEEWRTERARGNAIAAEATGSGVWLVGSREELDKR